MELITRLKILILSFFSLKNETFLSLNWQFSLTTLGQAISIMPSEKIQRPTIIKKVVWKNNREWLKGNFPRKNGVLREGLWSQKDSPRNSEKALHQMTAFEHSTSAQKEITDRSYRNRLPWSNHGRFFLIVHTNVPHGTHRASLQPFHYQLLQNG